MQLMLRGARVMVALALLASPAASALAPPDGATKILPPPFTPRWVDERQEAAVGTPCCASGAAAANATDPNNSGFYDSLALGAAANATLPPNLTVPRLVSSLIHVFGLPPSGFWLPPVPLPPAGASATANVSGYDSHVSDSFDHADANVTLQAFASSFPIERAVGIACVDGNPYVPGPESCA